jgi:hypothetical protein
MVEKAAGMSAPLYLVEADWRARSSLDAATGPLNRKNGGNSQGWLLRQSGHEEKVTVIITRE